MARERSSDADAAAILQDARTIAVLGAHDDRSRAAFYVPDYLRGRGYRILPVNPTLVGTSLWGEPVRATLAELAESVDVVDVFRRASHLPGHTGDLLAMAPAPKVLWLQLGIRHPGVAAQAIAAGIDVVQDRCTLADHKRLLRGAFVG